MLFSDTYLTVASSQQSIYKDKGSKFLAFAFPVETEQHVKEELLQLKKEYPTANHHCYAYLLGADKQHYRANDDGEPSYTAGKPILGQIQSSDLTNVLIVIVRYFGGTLLGVSGLINAYKTAAAEVIKRCEIIEKQIMFRYQLAFGFNEMNEVMKLLKQLGCKIHTQQFDTRCLLSFSVRKSQAEQCEEKLKLIPQLKLDYL